MKFFWIGIAVILPTIVITVPDIVIEACGGLAWVSMIVKRYLEK
ncbi:hypothetical protein [Orenia metallireducens]|nr:hypothetical protein [Orenia metallireducens]